MLCKHRLLGKKITCSLSPENSTYMLTPPFTTKQKILNHKHSHTCLLRQYTRMLEKMHHNHNFGTEGHCTPFSYSHASNLLISKTCILSALSESELWGGGQGFRYELTHSSLSFPCKVSHQQWSSPRVHFCTSYTSSLISAKKEAWLVSVKYHKCTQ